MSEVLIRCEGVGKKFCRDLKKSLWYGVKDSAADLLHFRNCNHTIATPTLRPGEFWANQNISFEVRRGECLGLIGRNGAGKTTLLKMLSGLIKPDEGRISIRGRVGALIALGAGFNPVLTGRENIIINGAILGLSRAAINDRLEKIVEFAGISHAIDAPVQSYSSGMQVRVGFATASNLITPDVLFLDEVLAVGDVAFRNKCYNRIAELKEITASIFVSHTMAQVATTATMGMLLSNGAMKLHGETSDVITAYNAENSPLEVDTGGVLSRHDAVSEAAFSVRPEAVHQSEHVEVEARIESSVTFERVYFHIVFYNSTGEVVGEWNGHSRQQFHAIDRGFNALTERIDNVQLLAGTYKLGVAIKHRATGAVIAWSFQQITVEVSGESAGLCAYQMH